MNMLDAIQHIRWTLEHSDSTYDLFREDLTDLSKLMRDCETKFQQRTEPNRRNRAISADEAYHVETKSSRS